MRILIIEDDRHLAAAIADYLELQQAECDFAFNGAVGLQRAAQDRFDAIILDLMLPKMNGFDLCLELRRQGIYTPVLMLTACDTDEEQLQGFRSGVDDYVAKPCAMPLLWARLQALARRASKQGEALRVGPLKLRLGEHRATREGRELKLTPTGWRLLVTLMRRSPDVVSREQLEAAAWPGEDVDPGNFNVQLHQLRKAVDKPFAQALIHTVVGVGVCIREDGA
ncbi:response regulator transcription factor [Hahella sp. CR1]|uniref:response regulator transcription factor n=1 Tax=Hahella sp. CR1 TaxID=2992807 RepID=UPI002441B694|nr:response regulator transcription factor [Hahella sp. CR1]MDG9668103.1 response regulator transcription factor [Hahella sp. CR1]